ncbi:MAG: hypothetical protein H6718_22645 [Polyangiaceae bacterium]|nr:hypothetical protein [Myxococcales bacterium]MCB9588225.1 hypothetical protein [Polyangiaceae bacterium]
MSKSEWVVCCLILSLSACNSGTRAPTQQAMSPRPAGVESVALTTAEPSAQPVEHRREVWLIGTFAVAEGETPGSSVEYTWPSLVVASSDPGGNEVWEGIVAMPLNCTTKTTAQALWVLDCIEADHHDTLTLTQDGQELLVTRVHRMGKKQDPPEVAKRFKLEPGEVAVPGPER